MSPQEENSAIYVDAVDEQVLKNKRLKQAVHACGRIRVASRDTCADINVSYTSPICSGAALQDCYGNEASPGQLDCYAKELGPQRPQQLADDEAREGPSARYLNMGKDHDSLLLYRSREHVDEQAAGFTTPPRAAADQAHVFYHMSCCSTPHTTSYFHQSTSAGDHHAPDQKLLSGTQTPSSLTKAAVKLVMQDCQSHIDSHIADQHLISTSRHSTEILKGSFLRGRKLHCVHLADHPLLMQPPPAPRKPKAKPRRRRITDGAVLRKHSFFIPPDLDLFFTATTSTAKLQLYNTSL